MHLVDECKKVTDLSYKNELTMFVETERLSKLRGQSVPVIVRRTK